MISFIKKHFFAFGILLTSFILLAWFAYFNQYSEGGADTYWHYFYSRYAIDYPDLFFHHWGKPLFIFLSAPFSYFGGYYGLQLFNISCGILTTFIAYRFVQDMKWKFPALVIFFLLYGPLYFFIIQSGLTEPLMSLILVFSFYMLHREKWIWAAVVLSFSLFVRTEGYVFIFCALFYFGLVRQWKYISLLFTGLCVYSLAGFMAGHDFFWFFNENPYHVQSPYGHGPWMHFVSKAEGIWGVPQLLFCTAGSLGILIITFRSYKTIIAGVPNPVQRIFFLFVLSAFLFFMFHTVAWALGLFGSMGLERVMACISPFVAIIAMYGFHLLTSISDKKIWVYILPVLLIPVLLVYTFKFQHYPLKAQGEHKVELEIADWFNHQEKNAIVYYAHPFIMFHTHRNPFNKNLNREEYGLDVNKIPPSHLPVYIFWDSRFSEFSCGVKLSGLYSSPRLQPVKEMEADGFKVVVFKLSSI